MTKWTPEQREKFMKTVAKKKADAAEMLTKAGWKKADKKAARKKRKPKVTSIPLDAIPAKAPRQGDRHKNRPAASSKIDLALKLAEAITLLLK